mmetsp:Transcript_35198/g.56855  ORF Transcript_35198/g.56855 Transcript_35198/m.56855 type:complete len:200 (-) Transcript_35198:406-1005(-)
MQGWSLPPSPVLQSAHGVALKLAVAVALVCCAEATPNPFGSRDHEGHASQEHQRVGGREHLACQPLGPKGRQLAHHSWVAGWRRPSGWQVLQQWQVLQELLKDAAEEPILPHALLILCHAHVHALLCHPAFLVAGGVWQDGPLRVGGWAGGEARPGCPVAAPASLAVLFVTCFPFPSSAILCLLLHPHPQPWVVVCDVD